MTFIDALVKIKNSKGEFELCDDATELDGTRSCICVYHKGEFAGKLRWPHDGKPAEVDEELVQRLKERYGD